MRLGSGGCRKLPRRYLGDAEDRHDAHEEGIRIAYEVIGLTDRDALHAGLGGRALLGAHGEELRPLGELRGNGGQHRPDTAHLTAAMIGAADASSA